jgi:hypothetical protein
MVLFPFMYLVSSRDSFRESEIDTGTDGYQQTDQRTSIEGWAAKIRRYSYKRVDCYKDC